MSVKTKYDDLKPDLVLCRRFLDAHPPAGRILHCAVSGSHLYGFPSRDSDIDLKGIHLHPTRDLLGLGQQPATHDLTKEFEGTECDLTTNEVGHTIKMLLAGNGNILERILSPFQVVETPEVEQLQDLAKGCLSKIFYRHYSGYFRGMQEEHKRHSPPRVKPLLYSFRVVLSGVHLLKTCEVVTDLRRLADIYEFGFLQDLIKLKQDSAEQVELAEDEDRKCRDYWQDLEVSLNEALNASKLPEEPKNCDDCHEWLVSLRIGHLNG